MAHQNIPKQDSATVSVASIDTHETGGLASEIKAAMNARYICIQTKQMLPMDLPMTQHRNNCQGGHASMHGSPKGKNTF